MHAEELSFWRAADDGSETLKRTISNNLIHTFSAVFFLKITKHTYKYTKNISKNILICATWKS